MGWRSDGGLAINFRIVSPGQFLVIAAQPMIPLTGKPAYPLPSGIPERLQEMQRAPSRAEEDKLCLHVLVYAGLFRREL